MTFLSFSKPKGLVLTLLFGATLTVMSGSTIAPSLPGIREVFKDTAQVELLTRLVLTIPALFIVIFSPISGWIIDSYGRLKLLFLGLALYIIGGTSGIYTETLLGLIIGRGILGVGVAFLMNSLTTLMGDYFQGPERQRFIGYQSGFMSFGGMVYVTLGGFLADIHWRASFFVYSLAIIILIVSINFLYEPTKAEKKEDSLPENIDRKIVLHAVGIYVTIFICVICFYLNPIEIPFILKDLGIKENAKTGIAIATSTFAAGGISMTFSFLKKRLSSSQIYVIVFFFMMVGFTLIYLSKSYPMIILGLFFNGLGSGLAMPNGTTAILQIAPEHWRGRFSSFITISVFLGQFCSPFLFQPIIQSSSRVSAYGWATVIIGLVFFVYIAIEMQQFINKLRMNT